LSFYKKNKAISQALRDVIMAGSYKEMEKKRVTRPCFRGGNYG